MSLLSLFIALVILICISAFFSGSETGMMAVNRYRLRHLARQKHKTAGRVNQMLTTPERLLGVILIGNTFANILASAIATMIAVHLFGEIGVIAVTVLLTLVVLVFAEITPKTLAALHPERVTFVAAYPLYVLLKLFYPVVWLANTAAKFLLKCVGVTVKKRTLDHLSTGELKTLLHEAGNQIPPDHQDMLMRILDLENVQVEDVMIPLHKIVAIDLTDEWNDIVAQIVGQRHSYFPLCNDGLDNLIGMLPVRSVVHLIAQNKMTKEDLPKHAREAYFVPENTPLNTQLLNFKREKQRNGLVVDEYGDIQGYISLEDILEEIVGEFVVKTLATGHEVFPQSDGSYVVVGSVNIRELNRNMDWHFSTEGPKTMSGLVTEYLEAIPQPGTGLRVNGYPIEILKVQDNRIKTLKVYPKLRDTAESDDEGKE